MPNLTRTLALSAVAAAIAAAPAAGATVLNGVEAQRGPTADRLVFTFKGPLPATVRSTAVTRVAQDGSGAPVRVRGAAFREIVFEIAHAHVNGKPTCAPRVLTPTLELVVQTKMAGDFEGRVTYGVGLTHQVAPKVVRRPSARQIVLVFPR